MGKEFDDFVSILGQQRKAAQTMSLQWATVISVNWEERTCDAKGIYDDLEFYNILIGAGSIDVKPKIGTRILIGIINNDETTCALLSAEEIEKIEIKAGQCELTIDNGFLLKKENETLKKLLGDLIQACRNMVFQTNAGVTLKLLNDPEFEVLKTRFNNFLK